MKVRIYTDGACSGNPGPGGWGAILLFDSFKETISGGEKTTTNNRMELKAVIESIKLALRLGEKKLHIYSDSAYVVNAVKNEWIKKWERNGWKTISGDDVKNKDLWVELVELLKTNRGIHLIKVAGHSGDKYNELVDKLAKKEVEILKAAER